MTVFFITTGPVYNVLSRYQEERGGFSAESKNKFVAYKSLMETIVNDIADVDRRERRYRYAMLVYAELSAYPAEQKTPPDLLIQVEEIRKGVATDRAPLAAQRGEGRYLALSKAA